MNFAKQIFSTLLPLSCGFPSLCPNASFPLTPLQSALPQNPALSPSESAVSISLDLKSFRIRVYKKTRGVGVLLLTRNPIKALYPARPKRRQRERPSVYSVPSALESPFRPAADFSPFAQSDPRTSSLSLFTTHHPLLTLSSSFQGKIYPTKSRSHHV